MIDSLLGGAGRGVRPRRLPDRRGGARLPPRARPAARALRAALRRRLRDRDQARRGELGPGPRPGGPHAADLQRLAGRQRDRGAGALRAHRPARRAARPLPRHAAPAGQRALEAAGDEGDRLPPGRVVRGLPRAGRDAHLLDLAPRDDRRRGPDRVRARLAPLADVRRRSARSSTRRRTGSHLRETPRRPARSSTSCRSSSSRAAARSTTA